MLLNVPISRKSNKLRDQTRVAFRGKFNLSLPHIEKYLQLGANLAGCRLMPGVEGKCLQTAADLASDHLAIRRVRRRRCQADC